MPVTVPVDLEKEIKDFVVNFFAEGGDLEDFGLLLLYTGAQVTGIR